MDRGKLLQIRALLDQLIEEPAEDDGPGGPRPDGIAVCLFRAIARVSPQSHITVDDAAEEYEAAVAAEFAVWRQFRELKARGFQPAPESVRRFGDVHMGHLWNYEGWTEARRAHIESEGS